MTNVQRVLHAPRRTLHSNLQRNIRQAAVNRIISTTLRERLPKELVNDIMAQVARNRRIAATRQTRHIGHLPNNILFRLSPDLQLLVRAARATRGLTGNRIATKERNRQRNTALNAVHRKLENGTLSREEAHRLTMNYLSRWPKHTNFY